MVVRALARGVVEGVDGIVVCGALGVEGVGVCAIVTDPKPIKAVAVIISILAFIGILLFAFSPARESDYRRPHIWELGANPENAPSRCYIFVCRRIVKVDRPGVGGWVHLGPW